MSINTISPTANRASQTTHYRATHGELGSIFDMIHGMPPQNAEIVEH